MENNYSWALDLNYIAHYGVAADDNPPGRGSGRYPKGSGAKNGFRKITDAAARLKKFFNKNKVDTTKVDDDELFGLVSKSMAGKLSDQETGRMYDLLQQKYGKVSSMSDMDINFQNAVKDMKARKGGSEVKPKEESKPKEEPKEEAQKTTEQTEAERKAQHEAERQAALESGDRNEIMKYFNESSAGELQKAIEKANLRDQLNKSINEAKPKDTTKDEWNDYVKQELWSGDLKRILAVASDKSINDDELKKAINKATQVTAADAKANPTAMEKLKNVMDKGVNAYNTIAPIYNLAAATNNYLNNSKLPIAPQTLDKFIEGAKNITPAPVKEQPKPQASQQSNQSKEQPKPQTPAQPQVTPKQQQASQEVMNWLNTDILKTPKSEKFYQNTIVTLNKPVSSVNKPIEFTPSNNAYKDSTNAKWMKMTFDPAILNKKL